jgi:nucleolar complex protein 3
LAAALRTVILITMVVNGNKKRKIAHATSDDESNGAVTSKRAQKDFFKHASNWNLEQRVSTPKRKKE